MHVGEIKYNSHYNYIYIYIFQMYCQLIIFYPIYKDIAVVTKLCLKSANYIFSRF